MFTIEQMAVTTSNLITAMVNRVMELSGCDRETANLIVKEVLELEMEITKMNSTISQKSS